jgi:hypothetical protein
METLLSADKRRSPFNSSVIHARLKLASRSQM